MKSKMFWLTKKAENKVVLRHCTRTEIRTEKTSTSSFPPKAMRLPHSPCFANIASGTLSKNPFNGTAKWIYLFPCPLWVNVQCSAVFSLVASRNDGHFLRLYKRVPPVNDPTAMPYLWDLIRAKQQSMAATAWVIWLCACVRYWPDRGMVNVCLLFYVCKIEAAVSFISTY